MLRSALFALVAVFSLALSQAQAHFIWFDLRPLSDGGQQARLYFSEEPEPGEPHLIGKVAHSQAWVRRAGGKSAGLKLAQPSEDEAALVSSCPGSEAASLEAVCDYGIYQRGPGPGLLLQYYAKRLAGDWMTHPELARAEKLKLDLVPTLEGNRLSVDVLYGGKPSAGSEVVLVSPAGEHVDLKTDDQGRVQIDTVPGRWAIRAGRIEADKAGERDGKKYGQTWHYATLVLDVPETATTTTTAATTVSAVDTLAKARDGRAIWNEDFPGFTCDLIVHAGDEEIKGTAEIDANGIVTVEMPASATRDWVEEQLNSLVQHRMPEGEVNEGDVTFAEEEGHHPLGRKIDLGDPSLQSAYRIKDDVIMEVNRMMGPMRFTISVLEIVRNAENKYLPRAFTMNFFDAKSGELRSSLGYWNDWQRVGEFDLPKTIIEIDAHKGGANTKDIRFENLELVKQ